MLRDYLILKSSVTVTFTVDSYQQNKIKLMWSYRVRIISTPTFSATNVQRQNTEHMKQRIQNS